MAFGLLALASTNWMRPFGFRADQGRLLDYVVSWGNLTEEKAAYYLRDVLEALHYLHSRRIAHLDVKVSPLAPDISYLCKLICCLAPDGSIME